MLKNTTWYKLILLLLSSILSSILWCQSPIILEKQFGEKQIVISSFRWITIQTTDPIQANATLDKKGKITLENSTNLHIGYKQPSAWVKFKVQNKNSADPTLLEIDNPSWDVIRLYEITSDGIQLQYETGDTFSFFKRPLLHRDFLLPLSIKLDSTATYLLQLDRHGSYMNIGLRLWEKNKFIEYNDSNSLIHGMYFGSVIIYMIFALLLFVMMKDLQYLFYTGWLLGFANVLASGAGFTFHFIHPETPAINGIYMVESEVLSIIMLILFTKRFLDTNKNLILLNTILNVAVGTIIGLTIIGLTFIEFSLKYRGQIVILLNFIWISAIVSLLIYAIASFKRHPQKSAVFILVFIILFSSILSFIGNSLGIFQIERRYLVMILYGGSSAEIFLFTVSIAFNIRDTIIAHNQAILKIQQMQADLFEIEKKTVSSERSRISLELHDHVANKLAVLLQQVRNKKISETEISQELNEITQDVRYLSHALSPLNESENFEDTLREWALHLQNKTGIKIHVDSSSTLGKIKKNMLLHIFRIIQEAVGNAIKHGKANNVFIQFSDLEDKFFISIEDDGIGFSPAENYSGLGLKHMHVRAKYMNAQLLLTSTPSQGTYIQLIMTLPNSL